MSGSADGGGDDGEGSHLRVVSYRSSLHDVPPDGLVPAALAEVQQVVHHHLANQVMPGESVKVVHGEVQLPGM